MDIVITIFSLFVVLIGFKNYVAHDRERLTFALDCMWDAYSRVRIYMPLSWESKLSQMIPARPRRFRFTEKHCLSIDLLHAVVQDKGEMHLDLLLMYLYYCCGVSRLRGTLIPTLANYGFIFELIHSEVIGFDGYKKIYVRVRADCQQPVPVLAYPEENVVNICLAYLEEKLTETYDELRMLCVGFKIDMSAEKLNFQFGCNYDDPLDALKHGLKDYVLTKGKRKDRAVYIGHRSLSALEQRRFVYAALKRIIWIHSDCYHCSRCRDNIHFLTAEFDVRLTYRQMFDLGILDKSRVPILCSIENSGGRLC